MKMNNIIITRHCILITLTCIVLPLSGQIGKVGINTTLPQAMLHVMDSSVLFSGPLQLPMVAGLPPVSGAGRRMMWYADKTAFRAGYVTGQHWDRNYIGHHSFATGNNTTASGNTSTAFGGATSAEGHYSTAMGIFSLAIGYAATAMGEGTLAQADRSYAAGSYTGAYGTNSVAMGRVTQANGFSSLVIGEFNDTIVSPQNVPSATTPFFIIGNGTVNMPSNAMVVRKDGHVGLGTNTPANILDVGGGMVVGSGLAGSSLAPANGLAIQGNVGIGTTVPKNKLDIQGGMALGVSYAGIHTAPLDGLIIKGKTGIGTSTVFNMLDVEGGMAIGSAYSGSNTAPSQGLIIQGNTGIGTPFPVNNLDIEGRMAVGANYSGSISAPTNGMIIQGNVGIGTYSPDRRLHVSTGDSGAPSNSLSVGVFESASNTYISLLAQSDEESGILFSLPGSSSHGGIIYNNSSYLGSMLFRTNGNINRMIITDEGKVAIGSSAPTELLRVGSVTGDGIQIGSAEVLKDAGAFMISINANYLPFVDNSYDLGSASFRWDDVWATNGMIQTSDARDKKDISNLENGLASIMQLKPVKYKWNTGLNQKTQIGLIAQDVQVVIPEAVRSTNFVKDEAGNISEVNTERLGMNYSTFTPVLIKAVQEQQYLIEQQQIMLDQQAGIIQNLLLRVEKLEND